MSKRGGVNNEITPAQLRKFFDVLSKSGITGTACKASGISRASVYRLLKNDKIFAERFDDAKQDAADLLEQTVYKRAVEGVVVSREPVFYYGQQVGEKVTRKYSDTLLIAALKANRPEKWRDSLEINMNWRLELQQQGLDPEKLLQQQIEVARKQLESEAAVIEGETVELREVNEHRSVESGSEDT